MIKKWFLPCIAFNLSLLNCKFTSSTSTSVSGLPFFSVYTLLFTSLAIAVFRSFHCLDARGESLLFSLHFVINSSKTGLMLIRNVISVSTSFDSSAFLMAMYLSLLLTLASFCDSTSKYLVDCFFHFH